MAKTKKEEFAQVLLNQLDNETLAKMAEERFAEVFDSYEVGNYIKEALEPLIQKRIESLAKTPDFIKTLDNATTEQVSLLIQPAVKDVLVRLTQALKAK